MQKPIIIGNWKMNPTSQAEALQLVENINKGLVGIKDVETVICPPVVFMAAINDQANNFSLGAQNVFWQTAGTYTGEISPAMLKDRGCRYAIIGHSERRKYSGETNAMINKKVIACFDNDLEPILCIGEDLVAREANQTKVILREQLEAALKNVSPEQISQLIITYEPVWAISKGTKETRRPAQSTEVVDAIMLIRAMLSQLYSEDTAQKVRIIYGGSVDSQNVSEFLPTKEIAGALVGGASLEAEEFVGIVKNVNK